MRKSRGIYVDRGYVCIRIWPYGYQQESGQPKKPFRQWFGPLTKENLARAEFKLREYRNQIVLGKFGMEEAAKRMTIADACDVFYRLHASKKASAKDARRILGNLKFFWNNRYVDSITYLDVERYRAWRKELGNADATINRQHVVITSMFNKLARWVETNDITPVRLPKTNPGSLVSKMKESENTRRRALSAEEWNRLIHHATPRRRDIYLMAVHTLLRQNDLERLRKENYDRVTGELRGRQFKTKRSYAISLNPELIDIITGSPNDRVLDFSNFRKEFEAARYQSNIKDFIFKDLRRTGATWLYKDGMDLATISQLLGHSSVQMTESYIGVVNEHKQKATQLLGKRFKVTDVNTDVKSV